MIARNIWWTNQKVLLQRIRGWEILVFQKILRMDEVDDSYAQTRRIIWAWKSALENRRTEKTQLILSKSQ